MKKHTPTPWNIGKDGDIWAENNTHCIHLIPDTLNAEANAAFIVRCVNTHYELVNSLENLIGDFVSEPDIHGDLKRAKAALRKAKGE